MTRFEIMQITRLGPSKASAFSRLLDFGGRWVTWALISAPVYLILNPEGFLRKRSANFWEIEGIFDSDVESKIIKSINQLLANRFLSLKEHSFRQFWGFLKFQQRGGRSTEKVGNCCERLFNPGPAPKIIEEEE